jgi:hypothetical protein
MCQKYLIVIFISKLDNSLLEKMNYVESLNFSNIYVLLSSNNFVNLKKLSLCRCEYIKNEGIENLINLESLNLQFNYTITEDAFKKLNK